MLGAPQTDAPKNKRRDSKVVPARSSKKPTPKPQGEGIATVVIYADLGEDKEERSALLAAAITTLQKGSKFKNLFDQLGLTVNERKIATKALVSMASREGIECLTTEVIDDRALLQEASEINFSDENMEVRYSDH